MPCPGRKVSLLTSATEFERAGSAWVALPARAISTKNKHRHRVICLVATGFSRWTFRCLGHTFHEALRLSAKIWFERSRTVAGLRAHRVGGDLHVS